MQAKRGEVPCPRSHSGQVAGILSRVSKAGLVVKLDTLYGFSWGRLIMMANPSSSIKHSPVNPTAQHPSALPTSFISDDTKESQGGKEMPNRHPPLQSKDRNSFTSVHCWRLYLPVNFSDCSRGREAAREIHIAPTPGIQESASVTAHHLFCPQLKSKGTKGTHETLVTPRNAA